MNIKNLYRVFSYARCRLLLVIVTVISINSIAPCLVYSATEGGNTISVKEAEKIIREYITAHSPWEDAQIKIRNINVPNNLLLSPDLDFEITASPRSTLIGRTAFSLNIKGDNSPVKTIWISADIDVWVDVVLTARSLKNHQIISSSDVYIGKHNLGDLPAGYLYKPEDTTGKRLKRFIGGNQPVTSDMLEDPPLLKRGDKVFIIAESDTIKVTALGIASEDGYKDRPVKVVNLQSKREVFGDVIDSGTIKVRW